MENKLQIIGFYHEYDDYGCFSNWYHAEFDYPRGHYINSEQYMMAQKVLTFRQYELANKIMEADDPAVQKKLGGTHFKEFDSEYKTLKDKMNAPFFKKEDMASLPLF